MTVVAINNLFNQLVHPHDLNAIDIKMAKRTGPANKLAVARLREIKGKVKAYIGLHSEVIKPGPDLEKLHSFRSKIASPHISVPIGISCKAQIHTHAGVIALKVATTHTPHHHHNLKDHLFGATASPLPFFAY